MESAAPLSSLPVKATVRAFEVAVRIRLPVRKGTVLRIRRSDSNGRYVCILIGRLRVIGAHYGEAEVSENFCNSVTGGI